MPSRVLTLGCSTRPTTRAGTMGDREMTCYATAIDGAPMTVVASRPLNRRSQPGNRPSPTRCRMVHRDHLHGSSDDDATRFFRRLAAAASARRALSRTAASAGGWATIQADTGNPPAERGEPFTFGFTVLQHGVTPAGWVETPTFLAIMTTTGERVEAKAVAQGRRRPLRRDCHAADRPASGLGQVQLTISSSRPPPQPLAVATAERQAAGRSDTAVDARRAWSGSGPRSGPTTRPSSSTRPTRSGREIAILDSKVTLPPEPARRRSPSRSKRCPRAARAPTPAPESVPLFAVIAIAVLAGRSVGFAMTMLGRTSRPTRRARDRETVHASGASSRRADALPRLLTIDRGSRQPGLRPGRPAASSAAIAAGVSCSRRRRPNRAGRSACGNRLEPAPEERLALVVDEDVRPPQRMLDELEPLRGDGRGEPPDPLEAGEDLVVRRAVGVAHQRGVDPDSRSGVGAGGAARRCVRRRRGPPRDRRRSAGRPARRARRAGRPRSAGGDANSWPRSARPSLIRHSGVLIRRMLASSRPQPLDELGLLPGVLEVVARVRLVGDDMDQVRGPRPAGRCSGRTATGGRRRTSCSRTTAGPCTS